MAKIKFIKSDKIKPFLRKLPTVLAEHAFLASLFSVFVSILLGTFFFYKYYISAQELESLIVETPLEFKEEISKEVLDKQGARKQEFEAIGEKEYFNPFKKPVSEEVFVPEELTE